MRNLLDKTALVSFGEAGSAFAEGWNNARSTGLRAYDAKFKFPEQFDETAKRYGDFGVQCCKSIREAVGDIEIVVCAVTADQAVAAASSAAPCLNAGTHWFDFNSCAPASKRQAAEIIGSAGGRYVDVAVMSPVRPLLNMVPLLISGDDAETAAALLRQLPMAPRVIEGGVGAAASAKLLRSVYVKGLEALTAELALAATEAGVAREVFDSLEARKSDAYLQARTAYNFGRSIKHGARRSSEMEEAASMIADLGLPNEMSLASAAWQQRLAESGRRVNLDDLRGDGLKIAAALLLSMRQKE